MKDYIVYMGETLQDSLIFLFFLMKDVSFFNM